MMSAPENNTLVHFALRSGGGTGALAIIELRSDSMQALDALLAHLGAPGISTGELHLRDVAGTDQAIVARLSPTWAQLMCHDGPAVLDALRTALREWGAHEKNNTDPCAHFPEAATLHEACLLDALATAASPLAVDLLLAQPALWANAKNFDPHSSASIARAQVLNRLINPPLVVAVGVPNVGKSTLLNALAGSSVALASPEAGTTRDHVGAMLELGGLVVRWADTPGLRATGDADDPVERDAAARARAVIEAADLIIHCGDAAHGFIDVPFSGGAPITPRPPRVLRVATRTDRAAVDEADVHTAAGANPPQGLEMLVEAIIEALVPAQIRNQRLPWVFHELLAWPEKGKAAMS